MNKSAKIYIAGHNGLVGSGILRYLKSQGYHSFALRSHDELDLTDQEAVDQFFTEEKPEFVFLAAAKVGGIYANNVYRADFIYSNLEVQNNVVMAAYKFKVKKLLFLGSSCIYPRDAPQPIQESSLLTGPLEYTNEPYAIAKIAGIKLIESLNIQYGTNFLAVMPTNLYGYNDNFDLEKSHVMPALIHKMMLCSYLETGQLDKLNADLKTTFNDESEALDFLGKHGITKSGDKVCLGVWGTGEPYREFLHVDDMAEACVFVMNNVNFKDLITDPEDIRNTHINIGTGQDLKIKELAQLIKKLVGFKGDIVFDATKPDGTPRKLLSVDKINKLGWKHKIDFVTGLERTIDWYQNQSEEKESNNA